MREKAPATINEQIRILKQRGCIFEDEVKAREVLKHINYYRLSNYFEPFSVSKHKYEEGTSFNKIMRVYEMDRKLRSILMAALEEFEISLRAVVSNYHALKYGALGYLNGGSFGIQHNHQSFLARINHLIESSSDRDFVKHYNTKYGGKFPLWVMVELFSFGQLAFFYKEMQNADKKAIATGYYGCSPSELDNWVFCMNELRNYCAHYNRLYASRFPVDPKTPRDFPIELEPDLFGYIIILKHCFYNKEHWNERVVKPVSRLINKSVDDIRLSDMGFPSNWENLITFVEV